MRVDEPRLAKASQHESKRRLVEWLPDLLADAARDLARFAATVPRPPDGSGRPPEAVSTVRALVVDERLGPDVPDDQPFGSITHRPEA